MTREVKMIMDEYWRTEESVLCGTSEDCHWRQMGQRTEEDLREGKGHQSTTNHYKVKDVP